MWWNRLLVGCAVSAVMVDAVDLHPEPTGIGCPPAHNGQPLERVGLFDGPPSEHVELMPRPGRFVIKEGDEPSSRTLPHFTLGCTYRGSNDVVTVILPREVRVCEFKGYPRVDCH
jgi:hypothetical protein